MVTFEWVIVLLLGAALLSALARRLAIPYPTLLAIGGACLAFVPNNPGWTLDPHLALTLFVAPVLLDAAYDSSPRDLKDNWRSVISLAVIAVGATTAAVAVIAHALVPAMPWPVAIALGAIVAPPDAAAATAVLRQVRLPNRILTVLEGESLINDASALIVYRVAVLAAVSGSVSATTVVPAFLITVVGSVAAGFALAWLFQPTLRLFHDVPTALIVQFASTFGVWIAAEAVGLSGILTIVVFAMTVARFGRLALPARMRVPVNAVWETVVFVLNILAFVLIGMQLRPIWDRLDASTRFDYVVVALAVLATAVVVRFAWVMGYNAVRQLRPPSVDRRTGRPIPKPTLGSGVIISWAGMRGIVTLATAFALPETLADGSPFPYRDLVLLTAFAVVFGTLVIQGLTLKPLIALMGFKGEDPVGEEVKWARAEAYRAAIAAIDGDTSDEAMLLRKEYGASISATQSEGRLEDLPGNAIRRAAIVAARNRANTMRLEGAIGDAAYRVLESEFDWAELSAGSAAFR